MDLTTFIWSVVASILAGALGVKTLKNIHRNKTKNKINQPGNNNNAIQNSTININSSEKQKKEED